MHTLIRTSKRPNRILKRSVILAPCASFPRTVYVMVFSMLLWHVFLPKLVAQSYTISGYVEDVSNGERIPKAHIFIPALDIGVTTNLYGFYSVSTQQDTVQIIISHVRYDTATHLLALKGDTTLILALAPRVVDLEEIEVTATARAAMDAAQMSSHVLPVEQIENLPVILGEPDLQKVLQLLPGIQSGIEASSGLHVRGGQADQNLVMLDGIPLYNTSHVFGFLSVFHPATIKNVEIIKGGFPARYGGRISSVVNYTMKDGNLKTFAGEGSVGLLSSHVMLEGPILKDRFSFIVAA